MTRLEIPFIAHLPEGGSVLIAGMGGGFDVFCGLPLLFELQERGYSVHLANLSFSPLPEYRDCTWPTDTLVGATSAPPGLSGYHPERFLARWFREARDEDRVIWCMEPTGARTVCRDLRVLRERLGFDTIVLVDGGVDSLMRGDEDLVGTVLEDYVSLAAVAMMDEVPTRIVACIGMTVEGDVAHAAVFENIAALTRAGGHLGTTALNAAARAYAPYERAVEYVHSQPSQQASVINASIVSSARGHFGDYHRTDRTRGSVLWINPLMSLYWFFTVDAVAARNRFLPELRETTTAHEAFGAIYDTRERIEIRTSSPIPIP